MPKPALARFEQKTPQKQNGRRPEGLTCWYVTRWKASVVGGVEELVGGGEEPEKLSCRSAKGWMNATWILSRRGEQEELKKEQEKTREGPEDEE